MLTYFYVADSDRTAVVVDAPAVLLDAVDALGVGADVIDVERQDAVVGIDVDVVDVVGRTPKPVAVDALDEAFAFFTLLLK